MNTPANIHHKTEDKTNISNEVNNHKTTAKTKNTGAIEKYFRLISNKLELSLIVNFK